MIKVEKQKYTTQSGQLMAVMEQLQLSGMERRLAESYLKGESGKESRPSPPQREIAVLVLSKWNTPQDRAALWSLREREKNGRIKSLLEEALDRTDEEDLCQAFEFAASLSESLAGNGGS